MIGLEIIVDFLSSKDGDELFEKTTAILRRFGISAVDVNGNSRSLYDVLCDVAEKINQGK